MLCGVAEYDELPVRHNEDKLNMMLSGTVRFPIKERDADDPHAKAKLLLQVRLAPGCCVAGPGVGCQASGLLKLAGLGPCAPAFCGTYRCRCP